MSEVIIRHPKSGLEYAVQLSDYRRGKHTVNDQGEACSYSDAGFEIVSKGDGSEYVERASRRSRAEAAADDDEPKSGEHNPS